MTVVEIKPLPGRDAVRDFDPGDPAEPKDKQSTISSKKVHEGNLRPGDLIYGRIRRIMVDGKALVRLLGLDVPVTMPKSLPEGARLTFKVAQTQPKLLLNLVDNDHGAKTAAPHKSTIGPGNTGSPINTTGPPVRGSGLEKPVPASRMVPSSLTDPGPISSEENTSSQKRIIEQGPLRDVNLGMKKPTVASRMGLPSLTDPERISSGENTSRQKSIIEQVPLRGGGVDLGVRKPSAASPREPSPLTDQARTAPDRISSAENTSLQQRVVERVPLGQAWEEMMTALRHVMEHDQKPSALQPLVRALLQALDNYAYGRDNLPEKDFFRSFLHGTGQTLENDLFKVLHNPEIHAESALKNDSLKSLLLEFIQSTHLEQKPETQAAVIEKAVESAVGLADSLELGQVINNLAHPRDTVLFFQVPFNVMGQFSTGYLSLKFRFKSEGRQKKSGETVMVFFLDLPSLGGIRVDAGLSDNKRVRITVQVEKQETLSFVQQELPSLAESITQRNLQVEYIQAKAAPRSQLEEVCRQELEAGILKGSIHVVV